MCHVISTFGDVIFHTLQSNVRFAGFPLDSQLEPLSREIKSVRKWDFI